MEEARTRLNPDDPPELRAGLELKLGQALIALGQRERADAHLQAARGRYPPPGVSAKRLELYPPLVDNLEAFGRHAEALDAMREYKRLSDEAHAAEIRARLDQSEGRSEAERMDLELRAARDADTLQRARDMVAAAEAARRRTVTLALGGLLAALVLGLVLVRRHQGRRRGPGAGTAAEG